MRKLLARAHEGKVHLFATADTPPIVACECGAVVHAGSHEDAIADEVHDGLILDLLLGVERDGAT